MLSFDYDSSNYTYNEKSDTISITKTPNSDGEIDPYINYYIDSYFS
jgi:hypothetical protein